MDGAIANTDRAVFDTHTHTLSAFSYTVSTCIRPAGNQCRWVNRVRVCVHAGTTWAEIDALCCIDWRHPSGQLEPDGDRTLLEGSEMGPSGLRQLLLIEIVVALFLCT